MNDGFYEVGHLNPWEDEGMFGFEKKKMQLKSVEDYLRVQEVTGGDGPERKLSKAGRQLIRMKRFGGPTLGILFILILVAAALSQFNGLRSEIAAVKDQKSDEVKELKRQLADLSAKLEVSEKQATRFVENIAGLEKAVQTERAERIKAEEAAKRAITAAINRFKATAKRRTPAVHRKAAATSQGRGVPRQVTLPIR